MLAPRVPPTALVVGRAIRRAVVLVAVSRAEPVTVLEGQRVGRVAPIVGNAQPIAAGGVRHSETRVVRPPTVTVYVGHVDAQRSFVVRCQPVYGFVAQPKVVCENGGKNSISL